VKKTVHPVVNGAVSFLFVTLYDITHQQKQVNIYKKWPHKLPQKKTLVTAKKARRNT
jgi:hypothetical protein